MIEQLLLFERFIPAAVLAFILDLIFGDPRWLYHPVRVIGNMISLFEKILRGIFPKNKVGERIAGVFLVLFVTGITTAFTWAVLHVLYGWNFWVGFALETFWCYQLLATKSLKVESMRVYDAVKSGDIEKARYAVSMIVGRDTKSLTMEGVTKAAVETVAENSSDGIIAPLLFMMIGGAVGAFFYKSINTMDSMVGYVDGRFKYFGTFAAKLDDVVNFIPARLAGLLMIAASFLCGFDGKNAHKIFWRDRKNHASPNSAHTESVMAGALDVQLAGDAYYFGVLHKKMTIGDAIRPVEAEDIPRSNKLLYGTAIVSLLVFGLIRALILLVLV
ncbi:MAG: adenosylcobinamide-phosphate synthase CbiB [Lachnospiraceae bacterium]|nr:adenosylcobinamide-phosphate synthase CbiB [Lachnospiraceae bacterium]